MRKSLVVPALFLALLCGCSHIPDPAAIPKVEPADILQNIRCEIAYVLRKNYPLTKDYPVNREQRKKHVWIRESNIAYGLTLRAEEKSAAQAKLGFIWPINLGTLKLDANAGKERFRSGETVVTLAEELKTSLNLVPGDAAQVPSRFDPLHCVSDSPSHAHSYPILGSIGMEDIIRRFVEVNSIGSTAEANPEGKGKFQHTLKFRLKFLGGIKPSFAIERLDSSKLSGEVDLSAHREDIHELIIEMAPAKPDEVVVRDKDGKPRIKRVAPSAARKLDQRRLLESIERQLDRQRFRDDLREELQR